MVRVRHRLWADGRCLTREDSGVEQFKGSHRHLEHILPVVRAEAAPIPANDARPLPLAAIGILASPHGSMARVDASRPGKDRCVHSLITLCCVILGQPQASAAHQGVLCG